MIFSLLTKTKSMPKQRRGLIEFKDLQCPNYRQLQNPQGDELDKDNKLQICSTFKPTPLPSFYHDRIPLPKLA